MSIFRRCGRRLDFTVVHVCQLHRSDCQRRVPLGVRVPGLISADEEVEWRVSIASRFFTRQFSLPICFPSVAVTVTMTRRSLGTLATWCLWRRWKSLGHDTRWTLWRWKEGRWQWPLLLQYKKSPPAQCFSFLTSEISEAVCPWLCQNWCLWPCQLLCLPNSW